MYQKYQTEALVLANRERGENDRLFTLYTRDFGMVHARASAVRKETSRMRYALTSYARAHVALVRGNRGWRIGGAAAISDVNGNVETFARIARLALRLVAGEEQNVYLYCALTEAHSALQHGQSETRAVIELVCVARMLYALGYLSSEALSSALFTHTAYTGESLVEAENIRDKLLDSVNKAIAETQL